MHGAHALLSGASSGVHAVQACKYFFSIKILEKK